MKIKFLIAPGLIAEIDVVQRGRYFPGNAPIEIGRIAEPYGFTVINGDAVSFL